MKPFLPEKPDRAHDLGPHFRIQSQNKLFRRFGAIGFVIKFDLVFLHAAASMK